MVILASIFYFFVTFRTKVIKVQMYIFWAEIWHHGS